MATRAQLSGTASPGHTRAGLQMFRRPSGNPLIHVRSCLTTPTATNELRHKATARTGRTSGLRAAILASATSMKKAPYQGSQSSDWCAPSIVTVDNEEHRAFSVFNVEAPDYPGLLRVLAWAMNGLEIRVQNAKLSVNDEGMAVNKFWVTNYKGEKLTDKFANQCAQRLMDFAIMCSAEDSEKTQFSSGMTTISNSEHEKYTLVAIAGEPDRQGFLLEVLSVLSGLGFSVQTGAIQGCEACDTGVALKSYDATAPGRSFEFFITTNRGEKLDAEEANALLFVLGMLVDPSSHGPTVAPVMYNM